MKAKSIKGKSREEIKTALHESMVDGFKPTLAIIFISIKLDRKAACEILHREGINIIGATSCGLFTNGYQDGYQGEGSAVILLLDLNPQSYLILFEDIGERNLAEVAAKIAKDALQKFKKPAFIICSTGVSADGNFLDGEILVRSLESVLGRDAKIYGGMAGDDVTFTGTYVFTYKQSTDFGVAALVLDEEKINLYGMAISGWKPLGIKRTATKSEGGWLYTIDDKPALEMYLKYLGKEPLSEDNGYKMFEDIGVYYPFQVEGIGDPIMRTPVTVNKESGALKLDFEIPQGTKLRFSMPPDFDIIENVLENASELKKKTKADSEALLIFSCAGRLSALGPLTNEENEGLSKIWNAPMAGFFTYGEYGTVLNDRQGFHSTTCCWVALKEINNSLYHTKKE